MYEFLMRQLQSWTPSPRELSLLHWVNAETMDGVESTCENTCLAGRQANALTELSKSTLRTKNLTSARSQKTDLWDKMAHLVSETVYSSQHLHTGMDGRLLNGVGTFGFIWGSPSTRTVIATGKGHVPSDEHNISLACTELCGIFASLTYLRLIVAFYHIVICLLYTSDAADE